METNLGFVNRESLFDTLILAAKAALGPLVQFFAAGQSATKSEVMTNLTKDGEIPAGHKLDCYGIRLAVLGCVAADLAAILAKPFVVILKVNGRRRYGPQPLIFCAAGAGDNSVPGNGEPSIQAVVQFTDQTMIPLTAGDQVVLELKADSAYTLTDNTLGATVIAMLDGVHTDPLG